MWPPGLDFAWGGWLRWRSLIAGWLRSVLLVVLDCSCLLFGSPVRVSDHDVPPVVPVPGIDTSVSHSARVWDYWLGGQDNYEVDRQVGDRISAMLPDIVRHARADRMFLARAVRFLAGEAGIRQFLDIGAGLPAVDNTHEVALRAAPGCRVVYVDNDPLVLLHARALLDSWPEGAAGYLQADLRDPGDVLAGAGVMLDLRQPVAVIILGVLWHIPMTARHGRSSAG